MNFFVENRNYYKRKFVLIIVSTYMFTFCLMSVVGLTHGNSHQAEASSCESMEAGNVLTEPNWIYACGVPIGMYMETQGVMIIDAGEVTGTDGISCSPALHIVQPGDYIQSVDGIAIHKKKELVELLQYNQGEPLELQIMRNQEVIPISLTPVLTEDGSYKLGIWVRDNTQGLGTITYVKGNGEYGALGHGISDMDTNLLMKIRYGELYQAQILSVMKGVRGNPGEISGIIHYQDDNIIGTISNNSEYGIYGTIDSTKRKNFFIQKVEIGKYENIKTGKASILTTVNGSTQEYEIEITDIYRNAKDTNKAFALEVTDARLLEITGGIVQGMSGSPILQEGKLIGAVTHVFVNDPARGYGIFIEKMLEQ